MNSAQLQDWLTDLHQNLKGKQRSSRSSEFAAAESRKTLRPLVNNTKLLLNYLICNYEETEAVQPLVSQLLALYYRLGECFPPSSSTFLGVSRHFVVQVLPSLMYIYLAGLQRSQDSLVSIFETLFVAIYNEEILAEGPGAENFNKRVDQVRIPSIRFPSVYHDPSKLNTFPDIPEFGQNSNSAILVSASLCFRTFALQCSVQIGPYPAVESLIGENRYVVLTRLIKLVSFWLFSCNGHSFRWAAVCRTSPWTWSARPSAKWSATWPRRASSSPSRGCGARCWTPCWWRRRSRTCPSEFSFLKKESLLSPGSRASSPPPTSTSRR